MAAVPCVDIIVPVLRRPHRAVPFLASLWASVERDRVRLVVVADIADHDTITAWAGHAAVPLFAHPDGPDRPGTFPQKVNHGYTLGHAEWVLLVGDDVAFHPGWLDAALDQAAATGAQVVGTNDLGSPRVRAGEHTTHPMLRRSYVEAVGASWDGPGVVCHEGFAHQWVDDEVVLVAKQRDVWTFAPGAIIEHLHPAFGKGITDEVYEIGASSMAADRALFEERKARYAN